MSQHLRDVLATHVNEEVAVFRGSSAGELMWMSALSLATITPVMTIIGAFLGKAMVFLALSLVVIFVALFVMSTAMQQIRRGRPEGFFEQQMLIWITRLGFGRCPFIRHDGPMDCYRSKQILCIGKLGNTDDE